MELSKSEEIGNEIHRYRLHIPRMICIFLFGRHFSSFNYTGRVLQDHERIGICFHTDRQSFTSNFCKFQFCICHNFDSYFSFRWLQKCLHHLWSQFLILKTDYLRKVALKCWTFKVIIFKIHEFLTGINGNLIKRIKMIKV